MGNNIMNSVTASHIITKASRVVSIWSPWWVNYINKIEFIYYENNPSGITGLSSMIFIVGKDFLAKNNIMDIAIRLEFALQQSIRSMDTRYDFMRSKYPLIDDSLIGLAQSLEINSDMDDKFSVFTQSEWELLVSRKVDKSYIESLDITKPPRLKKGSWTSYDFDFPPLLRAEKYLDLLVELENNREQEWLDNQENDQQEENIEKQDEILDEESGKSSQQNTQDIQNQNIQYDDSDKKQENNSEQTDNIDNSNKISEDDSDSNNQESLDNYASSSKTNTDSYDSDNQKLNEKSELFNNDNNQQSSENLNEDNINNDNIDFDFNDISNDINNNKELNENFNNVDNENSLENSNEDTNENSSDEDSLNKENDGDSFDSNGLEKEDGINTLENNIEPLESNISGKNNDDILDDIEDVNIDNSNSHNSSTFQSLANELKQQSEDSGRQELQVPQKPDEEEATGKTREEKEEIHKQLAQDIEDLGDLKLPSGKSTVTKDFDQWKKKKLHKPKSSWKKIFPRMINPIIGRAQLGGQSDMSFSKRNPNQVEGAPLLMGFISYPPEVTVLIDASPSMLKYKDTTMSEFIGVMKGIFMTYAQPITIAAADSGIKFAMNSMTPYGYVLNKVSRTYHGSSVDFGDTIEQILKKGVKYKKGTYPKPDILVIFTDGLFKWPFPNKSKIPAKYADVLIVSTKPYDELEKILPPWVKNKKNFIAAE